MRLVRLVPHSLPRLVRLAQPPWSTWKSLDVGSFRKEHDRSRLQEATWNSTYLAEVQDFQWWQSRRKGGGKGGKKEDGGGWTKKEGE